MWHNLEISDLLKKINTDSQNGLNTNEVEIRQKKYGANSIISKKSISPIILFLQQFNQPLVYILVAAALTTAFLNEWVDSGVIFGVVLVNSIIGFVQESKAKKAIEALANAILSETTVIRDGIKRRIEASELTIGDIVVLQSGDKVPADIRLIHIRELQSDESALTGESVPVAKQLNVLGADTVLADRKNMVYSSSLITYGVGTGVVVEIGNETEVGKINQMIAKADILETPLTKKIAKFSTLLLYVILGFAVLTFIVGIIRGESVFAMFMAAVALSVGAIPEGLPAALTITLAIGVSQLAKKNAIIRKLPAVETLGSTSVICSDKTGTLTQNQMTVEQIYVNKQFFGVTGVGYSPEGHFLKDGNQISANNFIGLEFLLKAGLLCNDSLLIMTENGWKIEGDPTEGCLITAAEKAGLKSDLINEKYCRLDTIPFESEYQYMATINKYNENSNVVFMKGSVESIISRCSFEYMDNTDKIEYNKNQDQKENKENYILNYNKLNKEDITEQSNYLASKGLRVLAFAYRLVESQKNEISHEDLNDGLVFIGLSAMIDPPRPEAIDAVKLCKTAGINVKMITGDHEKTALAIAKKIGIADENDNNVLNGKSITNLSDLELIEKVKFTNVFARVAPEDKLRIVKALQDNDAIIAMTGDGVNDAPSLRQANIGIAMGITGTDVAKETADMILTDDNFASIVAAVDEGRGVYDNLIKFISWTLPTNVGEGLVIFMAVLLGTSLPIVPVQLLWINMTTAVFLGLMLAFEKKEKDIMTRKPRKSNESILNNRLYVSIMLVGLILCFSAFFFYQIALENGRSPEVARTIAVNIFVFGELFYLFNCKTLNHFTYQVGLFDNKLLIAGVFTMTLLQIIYTYVPFMNIAFQSAPLEFMDWVGIIGVGLFIFHLIEFQKYVYFRIIKN